MTISKLRKLRNLFSNEQENLGGGEISEKMNVRKVIKGFVSVCVFLCCCTSTHQEKFLIGEDPDQQVEKNIKNLGQRCFPLCCIISLLNTECLKMSPSAVVLKMYFSHSGLIRDFSCSSRQRILSCIFTF